MKLGRTVTTAAARLSSDSLFHALTIHGLCTSEGHSLLWWRHLLLFLTPFKRHTGGKVSRIQEAALRAYVEDVLVIITGYGTKVQKLLFNEYCKHITTADVTASQLFTHNKCV